MKTIACLLPILTFVFWCTYVTAQDTADSGQPPRVGPVTTDAEIEADLNLDAPGLEKVKAAIQANDLTAAKEAYLDYRRTASTARWTVMPGDEPSTPVETTDPIGNEICAHYIRNVYPGSLPVAGAFMGKNFNWSYNPLPLSDPNFTDQWTYCSVSRTPFWKSLADAYWKTHDEKYAAEWVSQLTDFAAKNPVHSGEQGMWGGPLQGPVTLWLSLDCGVRMSDSWPYAYEHFLNSPSFTPDAQWLYLKLLQEHGDWLHRSLSNPNRTGNWVTTECLGLYTIGVLFPELKDAAMWREFVIDDLTAQLDLMVPPDGFEAELTPGYHTVSIDGFRSSLVLAKLNDLPVPNGLQSKIISMYRALILVMDQSGNDVCTNDSWLINARYEAKTGLKIGDDPLLEWAALGGKKGAAPPDSTMLPYAGFYAMRGGWKPNDLFLFFRAGPLGIGHEHQDMLEVVLRAWNTTLLLDPGSYSYDTSDMRRFTMGTASHNTIIVDGKWQHRPNNKAPFTPVTNPWITSPLFDFVSGTYDAGYQATQYDPTHEYHPYIWTGPVDHSVTHTRRVLFLRPYYALVLDTLDGTGDHTFDAHFNLESPAAHLDPATQAAFSDNTAGAQLALYPLERENLKVDIVQGQKDPLLGWWPEEHRAIPTVRFRKQQEAPAIFATFLYPYQGQAPAFGATSLDVTGDGVWSQSLSTPHEKAEVVLVKDGTAKTLSFSSALLGAVRVTASGFVIRQPAGSDEIDAGGWDWRDYNSGKTRFTFDTPGSAVFTEQGQSLLFFNGGDKPLTVTVTHPFQATATLPTDTWTAVELGGSHPATAPSLPKDWK